MENLLNLFFKKKNASTETSDTSPVLIISILCVLLESSDGHYIQRCWAVAFQSKVKQLTAHKKDVCMISDVMLKQMFPDQSAV